MEVCSSHRRIRSSSAVRAQTHTASVSTTASVPLARTTPWGRGQGWFLFASDCSRWSHSTTPSERTCPPPSRPAVELKKQIPALLKLTNPGATSVAFKVSVPSIGPQPKNLWGDLQHKHHTHTLAAAGEDDQPEEVCGAPEYGCRAAWRCGRGVFTDQQRLFVILHAQHPRAPCAYALVWRCV